MHIVIIIFWVGWYNFWDDSEHMQVYYSWCTWLISGFMSFAYQINVIHVETGYRYLGLEEAFELPNTCPESN